jgi:hypothetical protein
VPEAPPPAAASTDAPRPHPVHVAPRSSEAPDTLAAERRLLDDARTAIARGDAGAGLAALDRHARDYPRGHLAEEREALRIHALVRSGRAAEAREAAARFHARFPNSLLGAGIDAATGGR